MGSVAFRIQGITVEIGGETEAGTVQRDVVGLGVVSISVSFLASPKERKLLTGF